MFRELWSVTALSVIQQLDCDISILFDCVSYLLHSVLICVLALQKSAKLSNIW